MTLHWWSLGLAAASLIVGAEAGFILAFRLLSDAQCGDCDEKQKEIWKRDLDPRLAALTPEQVERLFEKIMEPVKPSPVQHYDSLSALIRSTGARP